MNRIYEIDLDKFVPINEAIQSIEELEIDVKRHNYDQKIKALTHENKYLKGKLRNANVAYYEAEIDRLLSMLKRRNRQIDEMYDEILVLKGSSPVVRSDYWKKRLQYEKD